MELLFWAMRQLRRSRLFWVAAILWTSGCLGQEKDDRTFRTVEKLGKRVLELEAKTKKTNERLKEAEGRLVNIERVTQGVGFFELKGTVSPELKGRV